jgi:hypothetical protein
MYIKDRNVYGGGVAVYIQRHILVKLREDLMTNKLEVLWLQVHLPHLKLLILECCYRPPSANGQYLDSICVMLDKVSDANGEFFFLCYLNINWLSSSSLLKRKLLL